MPGEPTRDLIGLSVFLTKRSVEPGWDVIPLEGHDRGRVVARVLRAELDHAQFLTPKVRSLSPWKTTRLPGISGVMSAFGDQVGYRGKRITWPRCTQLPRFRGADLQSARRLTLRHDNGWVSGELSTITRPKVNMRNSKTRFNPSFAASPRRVMRLTTHGRYWDSVPSDLDHEDLRYDLDPFAATWAMMPDLALVTLPVVMGKCPWRDRSGFFMQDYAAADPETLYPSRRNGVLHRWARYRIGELESIANSLGISPHELPTSYDEADDMCFDQDAIAPPWLLNWDYLDRLEKSLRMRAYEGLPEAARCAEREAAIVDVNSRCFLKTGVHVLDGPVLEASDDPLIDELIGVSASIELIDYDHLRDSCILPMWTLWEDFEYPFFADGITGFFNDTDGWTALELQALRDSVQHVKYSRQADREPWSEWYNREPPPKIRDQALMLDRFVSDLRKRQNQLFVYG